MGILWNVYNALGTEPSADRCSRELSHLPSLPSLENAIQTSDFRCASSTLMVAIRKQSILEPWDLHVMREWCMT